MKKALSTTDLLATKHDLIEWDGSWYDNFDHPQASGLWFISGHSGNGKTSFMLELAKALTPYGNVLFNSLEEKTSKTFVNAIKRHNVHECGRKFQVIIERYEELRIRLKKRASPKFIITDSIQYTKMRFEQFIALKEEFPDKLFIWNSQMDGTKPRGKVAEQVLYDADLKIYVEGFKAFSKGRYMGRFHKDGYTIWDEGAQRYWTKT